MQAIEYFGIQIETQGERSWHMQIHVRMRPEIATLSIMTALVGIYYIRTWFSAVTRFIPMQGESAKIGPP